MTKLIRAGLIRKYLLFFLFNYRQYAIELHEPILPESFTTSRRRTGGSPLHKVRHNTGEYNHRNQTPLAAAC